MKYKCMLTRIKNKICLHENSILIWLTINLEEKNKIWIKLKLTGCDEPTYMHTKVSTVLLTLNQKLSMAILQHIK